MYSETKDMINEEEESEQYFDVTFRIKHWDGTAKKHEAIIAGHVRIRDLKEELKDELGVPSSTKWYLAKNNTLMSDDRIVKGNYDLECGDVINVHVSQGQPNVPEMTPVMATH